MRVLVDTSIWSLALRRAKPKVDHLVEEFEELIREGRVVTMGPIRQELLSGIKSEKQYQTLRDHLRAFPDLPLVNEDYEEAALCFNLCRARGIQGSNTDFLICAVAIRRQLPVFTADKDFEHYKGVLPLLLHRVRS